MNFWVRLHLLLCLTFCAGLLSAQNAGIRTTANQPRKREQWVRAGTGDSGTGRSRVDIVSIHEPEIHLVAAGHDGKLSAIQQHRQKLELRALRDAALHSAAVSAFPRIAPATVWTPLGPAPLASDASGLGVQDYGPVAGRATAVAIDRADTTGNTVYVGGAYGVQGGTRGLNES
jgi:hypothetical protein